MIGEDRPGSAAGNDATPGLAQHHSNSNLPRRAAAHKRDRVLAALISGPLSTFQAERAPVFDHCLPSTISELRKVGLEILTTMITVNGYAGTPTRIAEYTLTSEGRIKAIRLLGVRS